MPPKKQINKQQIIDKAFDMVRSEGYDSLTARRLATKLNCSTQPIYQTFSDMKELKVELIKKAQETMINYVMDTYDRTVPLALAYILAYVRFSGDEKYLYQLIFTSGGLDLDRIKELNIKNINLNINMIIYANGIIMMKAFNALEISEEMLKGMLIHAYELFESKKV